MKKQEFKKLKKEEGFFSAFVLVFLVTLALMGVGASILVQSESRNVINQVNSKKSDYTAEGALFYSLGALFKGTLSDTTFEINGVDVEVDSFYSGNKLNLEVTATLNDEVEKIVRVEMQDNSSFWKKAIFVKNTISSFVTTRDSNLVDDSSLKAANQDLPNIDNTTLINLSNSQSHNQSGGWTPTSTYPASGNFYNSGTVPNVTHVYGDMTIHDNIYVYGIFVVDGSAYLDRKAHVNGVIYLTTDGSKVQANNTSSNRDQPNVYGGIYGKGQVYVSGTKPLFVHHNPVWMRAFAKYATGAGGMVIAGWYYE